MTHEEIIKVWFAIDELGGENVYTELKSYSNMLYRTPQKTHRAYIRFGLGYEFFAHEKRHLHCNGESDKAILRVYNYKRNKMKQEDIDFLRELQYELNTQENDGQAEPRFWCICLEKQRYV